MSRFIDHLFSEDELISILDNNTITENLGKLSSECHKVRFSVDLSESIRAKLASIGVSLSGEVPMSWISEDSPNHTDSGAGDFANTIVIYVSDASGSLIIGSDTYDIEKGRAFIFEKGLSHHTENTGSSPRLMIGPMSETGMPVGSSIFYFASLADYTQHHGSFDHLYSIEPVPYVFNDIGDQYGIYTLLTTTDGYAFQVPSGTTLLRWEGESGYSENYTPVNYELGRQFDGLPNGNNIFLYPVWSPSTDRIMCFGEDTKILCLDPHDNTTETYIPVKELRNGVLVKTLSSGYQPICMIGNSKIYNPANTLRGKDRLYKCTKDKYPELIDDLILTGCHSILTTSLSDQERADTEEMVGRVFVTENRYRLMACIDERAEPYTEEGLFTIWHFALEHEHIRANYGVYANGLLVETSSKRMMSQYSGMELL
jgi:hypothetical protein